MSLWFGNIASEEQFLVYTDRHTFEVGIGRRKRKVNGSLFSQQFRIARYNPHMTQTVHADMEAAGFRVSEDGTIEGWMDVLSPDYQTPLPASTVRKLRESLNACSAAAVRNTGNSFSCMVAMFDLEYAGEVGSNGSPAEKRVLNAGGVSDDDSVTASGFASFYFFGSFHCSIKFDDHTPLCGFPRAVQRNWYSVWLANFSSDEARQAYVRVGADSDTQSLRSDLPCFANDPFSRDYGVKHVR